jgi:hypothetical protein
MQLFGNILVELREAFEVTLRVARRDARGTPGGFTGAVATTRDQPRWLAERREAQLVRVLIMFL